MARFSRRASARLATLRKPRVVFLGEAGGDLDLVVASFEQWCAGHAAAACEIALSNRWVVTCVPPVGGGTLTRQELRQYARRQLAHYLDDGRESREAGWTIATSARADVSLACAASADLLSRLKATADAHGVSIRRISPWWAGTVAPPEGALRDLVVVEPGISTTFQFEQGCLRRIATEFDVDECPSEAIQLWTRREQMPVACDTPAVGAVVASHAWRRRALDLDLSARPVPASLASWLVLLVAVVLALVESQRADGLQDARTREQAMLDRVQASHARARHSFGPAAATGAAKMADIRALEAATEMMSLLQHPWADVFTGVEAASGSVAMLSLRHEASQPIVDIEFAAPSDDAAWTFAERMASNSKCFESATLLARQPLAAPIGALSERARVRAILMAHASVSQRGAP